MEENKGQIKALEQRINELEEKNSELLGLAIAALSKSSRERMLNGLRINLKTIYLSVDGKRFALMYTTKWGFIDKIYASELPIGKRGRIEPYEVKVIRADTAESRLRYKLRKRFKKFTDKKWYRLIDCGIYTGS